MNDIPDVALWPSRENYARFRAVCDDDVPKTFDEFEVAATAQLAAMAREGIFVQRIAFDPNKLAAWCRERHHKVDGIARAEYAAFIFPADKN
jgi:hypothetical protein